ncbi:hypothetical protein ACFJGW_19860 [Burkholderiaceae bacterium UC74_6]
MKQASAIKPALIVAAALAVLPASFAWALDKSEYETAKSRISADYKTDRVGCDGMKGNTRDVCIEQAKGKEKVALAELEHSYSGKEADRIKMLEARADANYSVAKEQCDDKAGNDKSVCVKEAKAAHTAAMADAKASKKIREARVEAADDKRDADYKAAVQKCSSLAGVAKDNCVSAAKAEFGKS